MGELVIGYCALLIALFPNAKIANPKLLIALSGGS